MTINTTTTINAKYLFCMNNGDIFEGQLNVCFETDEINETLWNSWWNNNGAQFIQGASIDAIEGLGIQDFTEDEEDTPVAFVIVTPLADLNLIIQCCSNPLQWEDNIKEAWGYVGEELDIPSIDVITEEIGQSASFGFEGSHLRLVEDSEDDLI
jgi:hypothetical protein